MWRKSPARSLDDPEDETFYDVECLTPDELAGRINDESFAHTEDYVKKGKQGYETKVILYVSLFQI